MAGTGEEFILDLRNLVKNEKAELGDTILLTQASDEDAQKFSMSPVGDNSSFYELKKCILIKDEKLEEMFAQPQENIEIVQTSDGTFGDEPQIFIKQEKRKSSVKKYVRNTATEQSHSNDAIVESIVNIEMNQAPKPFKCHLCQEAFPTSYFLKIHQLDHTSERPFKCQTCNKVYSTAYNLKLHQLDHTTEKLYKCQICEKVFSSMYFLKKHQREHTGEKPFQCPVCLKVYSTSSYLKKHQLVHSEEKPFQCHVCQKSYSTSSYLKTHMLCHTGEGEKPKATSSSSDQQWYRLRLYDSGSEGVRAAELAPKSTEPGSSKAK
ncbi:zinc finger protein 568 [Biomphalaria glabrata]|uniref:Zinc finger protein 568-like n=1 Tax=Biomphalaria glabrata TaxID=6526 RepID=A0A2C9JY04_BIOGL|nr:zinc finger protein 568-like [Biomphalaria glabrata]XP_013088341.1 zinc finger protein 568-like [Biomphalaria glabrata]XP_013088342.1 zinc finger protein 568-like [Biomphalaria glabrata]XP_055867274.1 zinc finger protein 568-like [Biomphalaria glabrata]XP_055867275.1 zinc finger protein 568-like [Biomphalaria glabrata]KAI8733795.1 zinc finger protein 568 [Biomphalaria glabrata]KAI8734395.1 zinc finger protein 568-like [Biomphalaria glabrata]